MKTVGIILVLVGVASYFVLNKQIFLSEPTPSPQVTPPLTEESTPRPPFFSDRNQSFITIEKKSYSGHEGKKDYIIKDVSSWSSLWNVVNMGLSPKPDLPNIDFDNEMIIAVFQGRRGTGGYSIEVVKIIEKEHLLEVTVQESSPPPGSMVTEAITDPFHIVKTKKTNKEIAFVH